MRTRSILIAVVTVCASVLSGCEFSIGTNTSSSNTTANANKAATNSANTSTAKTDTKSDKPKLDDDAKPTSGTAKTAKKNPVPESWLYVYDSGKGYGFYLPEGSTGQSEKLQGIDVMLATTPAPSEIKVVVLAYKDETRTKEELLDDAIQFLEETGNKVTPGKLQAESDEYAVADATTVNEDGSKAKMRILVGTDVTDNYVMILATEEAKFAANESIIDQIWGSFEMWSS